MRIGLGSMESMSVCIFEGFGDHTINRTTGDWRKRETRNDERRHCNGSHTVDGDLVKSRNAHHDIQHFKLRTLDKWLFVCFCKPLRIIEALSHILKRHFIFSSESTSTSAVCISVVSKNAHIHTQDGDLHRILHWIEK